MLIYNVTFSSKEFHCKCKDEECAGKLTPPNNAMVLFLVGFKVYICNVLKRDCMILISSGVRCHKHNKDVNGKNDSKHLPEEARAVDLKVKVRDNQSSYILPVEVTIQELKKYGNRFIEYVGETTTPGSVHITLKKGVEL